MDDLIEKIKALRESGYFTGDVFVCSAKRMKELMEMVDNTSREGVGGGE